MQERPLGLADYIEVLWRRKFLILFGALICALLVYIGSLWMPKVYEAVATLVLLPPKPSAEFKLASLSPEAYQSVIESDFVKNQVKQEMQRQNVLKPGAGIIKDLRAEVSGKANQPYKSIRLIAQADSPQKAELAANTWAGISIKESLNLLNREKKGALELMEKQHAMVTKKLSGVKKELEEKQDSYSKNLLKAHTNWEFKLLDLYKETERLQREQEKTTEQLRLGFLNKSKLDPMREELKAKEARLAKLEDDLSDLVIASKTKKDTLEQIKKEIRTQPKYLVPSKAITDEASGETINQSDGPPPKELDRLKVRSELPNPTYQSLIERLALTQIEYDTLVPKREQLQNEINKTRKEIESLRNSIQEKEIELFNLTKNRELELDTLLEERRTKLNILEKAREHDLKSLERRRLFEVSDLERRYDSMQRDFIALTQKYENARLVNDEEAGIRVEATATAPEAPIKPRVLFNTAIAFVVGLMTSVMLAFFVEYVKVSKQ